MLATTRSWSGIRRAPHSPLHVDKGRPSRRARDPHPHRWNGHDRCEGRCKPAALPRSVIPGSVALDFHGNRDEWRPDYQAARRRPAILSGDIPARVHQRSAGRLEPRPGAPGVVDGTLRAPRSPRGILALISTGPRVPVHEATAITIGMSRGMTGRGTRDSSDALVTNSMLFSEGTNKGHDANGTDGA
jgi:hypothetical protein